MGDMEEYKTSVEESLNQDRESKIQQLLYVGFGHDKTAYMVGVAKEKVSTIAKAMVKDGVKIRVRRIHEEDNFMELNPEKWESADLGADASILTYTSIERANKNGRIFSWEVNEEVYHIVLVHLVNLKTNEVVAFYADLVKAENTSLYTRLLSNALINGYELEGKTIRFDRQMKGVITLSEKFGFTPTIRSKASLANEGKSPFDVEVERTFNYKQQFYCKTAKEFLESLEATEALEFVRLWQKQHFANYRDRAMNSEMVQLVQRLLVREPTLEVLAK